MADNVAVTPGTGALIATDDDGTAQHQYVKLEWGPDNTQNKTDVASGKPLPVQLRGSDGTDRSNALPAAGFATTVSASVTKSTTITTYTVGDAWADSTSAPTAGGFTFSNAARISGGSGIITDIFISNSVGPPLMLQGELWIYDSAATADDDNVAFTVSDADVLLVVAVVPFTLAASAVGSVNSYAHIQNLSIGFTCVGSANLRFKVKVQNAYVNTASEVLNFRLKIVQTN